MYKRDFLKTTSNHQELLLRNEYLGAENRILRGKIKHGLLLPLRLSPTGLYMHPANRQSQSAGIG